MLVAPVTTPGNVTSERVWFPPGTWTDWFTGATFQGPSTQTLTVPLNRMPVFVKAGGIIPEQVPMDHVGAQPDAPLTLRVYPGGPGRFTLYQDAGSGTGYEKGQASLTSIRPDAAARGVPAQRPVSIGPAAARTPVSRPREASAGDPELPREHDRPRGPASVLLDGHPLAPCRLDLRSGDPYRDRDRERPGPHGDAPRVTEIGGTSVEQAEPAAGRPEHRPLGAALPVPGQTRHRDSRRANDGPGAASGTTVTSDARRPAGP